MGIQIADLETAWAFHRQEEDLHYAELERIQQQRRFLVHECREAGWSWEKIADEMGLSKQYVSRHYGGG